MVAEAEAEVEVEAEAEAAVAVVVVVVVVVFSRSALRWKLRRKTACEAKAKKGGRDTHGERATDPDE